MKKVVSIILCCLCLVLVISLSGCGKKDDITNNSEPNIANPWESFDSLENAEGCSGFELGMPEVVSDTYEAVSFSVMNSDTPLLQVIYEDESYEVVVRKAQGVGQDISGVYGFENTYTTDRQGVTIKTCRPSGSSETPNACLIIFDYDGFSWSLYAPNGYWGDSCEDFLNAIFVR